MRASDKLLIEQAIAGKRPSSTGWVRVMCPFCMEDGKLSVSMEGKFAGFFMCWKPKCGVRGFLDGRERKKAEAEDPLHRVALPDSFVPLTTESGNRARKSLAKYTQYLYHRGVGQRTINEVGIGCDDTGKYAGSVVVPISTGGAAVGYIARSIVGKVYKLAPDFDRRHMFNMDALAVETDVPAVIVEGVFDALPHWPFAVACLGQVTDAHFKLIRAAKRPVVFALDGDMQIKNEMYALMLRMEGVKADWLPMPAGGDPNGIDRGTFLQGAFNLFSNAFE